MHSDEATIQALRRDIALRLSKEFRRHGDTQERAARRLGIPQPTLSKIINGRVSDLSIELLLRIAVRAGLPMTMHTGRHAEEAGAFVSGLVYPGSHKTASQLSQVTRESMESTQRLMTPGERLEAFLEHSQYVNEIHQAARAARLPVRSAG